MSTIREWLKSIGMEQWADVFEREQIDLEIARQIGDGELKELGLPLGPRLKIKTAIAELSKYQGTQRIGHDRTETDGNLSPQAERRQLTVMFCDLVGSVALSQRLDPEELRSLIQAYRAACAGVIQRYEGYIARYVGDGILTYFGWPKAHEDDAERSVRAALEIVQAVKNVAATPPLSVHIGIATGPVVVGEQAGESPEAKLAVGTTPNLAARLQGLAESDQVVIASSTRRLVGNTFALADIGDQLLKGIAEPVHAWRVEGVSSTAGRFEATRSAVALTPLVGREQEIGLLHARWQQAQDGEGQAVLLAGEPGIGKSRILAALRDRLEKDGVTALRFQCSPYHANSAFYPSIDNFERALKFTREDSAESKLDRLEDLIVQQYGRPREDVRFIAAMLSLPTEQRYGTITMTPQRFKDETLRSLVDLTQAVARKHPTVMLFEDAHWADPTSLEVLDLLIAKLPSMSLLLVITHRPEFQSRWTEQGHVSALNLAKLTRAQSSAMVNKLAQGKALPEHLLDQIVAKTDGVPLFIEELTQSILESGELKDLGDRFELTGSATAIRIPATLQDSLMARLDRHPQAKEIAQIGAVIGREFSYELIEAVAGKTPAELNHALQRLTDSGLAFRQGTPPNALYTFKHALVKDTAYESLLLTRRGQLHSTVARTFQKQFPNIAMNNPAILAHHFSEAGLHDDGVTQWKAAGEKSRRSYATLEAIGHFSHALDELEKLPQSAERFGMELDILVTTARIQLSSEGRGPPVRRGTFERIRALIDTAKCNGTQFTEARMVLWWFHLMDADFRACGEIIDVLEGAHVSSAAIPPGQKFVLLNARMNVCFFQGQFQIALNLLRDAYECSIGIERPSSLSEFDWAQHRAQIPDFLSWTLLQLGYWDRAESERKTSLALVRGAGHPFSYVTLLAHALMECVWLRSPQRAEPIAQEVLLMAEKYGLFARVGQAQMVWGWALVELGQRERGIALLETGYSSFRRIGFQIATSFWLSLFAYAQISAQRFEDARRSVQEALQFAGRTDERFLMAELLRLQGELWLVDEIKDEAQAEQSFRAAIDVARKQAAKLFEIRATVSLARLWQSHGKYKEAFDLLAPVYNWFTEGFDTKDLQEAKALLDLLAARQ